MEELNAVAKITKEEWATLSAEEKLKKMVVAVGTGNPTEANKVATENIAKLEPNIVSLENLPALFSFATLESMAQHVPLKGKILSSGLTEYPGQETKFGYVSFEKKDDCDAAVRLWDQLAVDRTIISARAGILPTASETAVHPKSDAQAAPMKSTKSVKNTNPATNFALRYPFAPMSIGWLVEHVNAYKQPNKSFAMVRILECLMNTAVTTSDPYMEYAVVHFYTKFTTQQWGKAQSLMADGVSFELSRQVFEVIGLVRKFPSANPKSRKMLLNLVERMADDISKVSLENRTLNVINAIPEVITSIRQQLAILQEKPENFQEPHKNLVAWLKFLFACVLANQNSIPTFPEHSSVMFCGEDCPCYPKLKEKFTFVLGDVEKAKIVDSLIISAVRDSDEYTGTIAQELWERYNINFMYRAVRHIHNGKFLLLRLNLFRAIYTSRKVKSFNSIDIGRYYDVIETALHDIKEEVHEHPDLKSIVPLLDSAFQTLLELRGFPDICASAVQQLYTLQFDLAQIFNALCVPQYHLCVHVLNKEDNDTVPVPPATNKATKCSNPTCNVTSETKDLLKCSGCKVTYYCSVECQRSDWKAHRTVCKEIAARKSTVETTEPFREERVIMPSFTRKKL